MDTVDLFGWLTDSTIPDTESCIEVGGRIFHVPKDTIEQLVDLQRLLDTLTILTPADLYIRNHRSTLAQIDSINILNFNQMVEQVQQYIPVCEGLTSLIEVNHPYYKYTLCQYQEEILPRCLVDRIVNRFLNTYTSTFEAIDKIPIDKLSLSMVHHYLREHLLILNQLSEILPSDHLYQRYTLESYFTNRGVEYQLPRFMAQIFRTISDIEPPAYDEPTRIGNWGSLSVRIWEKGKTIVRLESAMEYPEDLITDDLAPYDPIQLARDHNNGEVQIKTHRSHIQNQYFLVYLYHPEESLTWSIYNCHCKRILNKLCTDNLDLALMEMGCDRAEYSATVIGSPINHPAVPVVYPVWEPSSVEDFVRTYLKTNEVSCQNIFLAFLAALQSTERSGTGPKKCRGTTSKGKPCQKGVTDGDYCHYHKK